MVEGYCCWCDEFTIGNICPPGCPLPGGARPCRHHEFPCSGRKRRAGRACRVRSRPGGRCDRGSRGVRARRARSRHRGRRPPDHASGSFRPNDCRGAGPGWGGRRTAPRAGCRSPCRSRARRQSGAGRSTGCGGRADGSDERERIGAGEQPRRRRCGRAGQRRRRAAGTSVSAGAGAVSGLDTGAGRPAGRAGGFGSSSRAHRGGGRLELDVGMELRRRRSGDPASGGRRIGELDLELELELWRFRITAAEYRRRKYSAVSTCRCAVSADQYQHFDSHQQSRQQRRRSPDERRGRVDAAGAAATPRSGRRRPRRTSRRARPAPTSRSLRSLRWSPSSRTSSGPTRRGAVERRLLRRAVGERRLRARAGAAEPAAPGSAARS